MSFPLAPLSVTVELDLGSLGWQGITSYAYQREGTSPPVVIKRGRANEQATASPSSVSMQWNNRDGRFSPRNPTGPYYGLLVRNTPLRVSVPAPLNYLRFADDATSYAQCPGSSGLELSGDIDVRLDMDLDNFAPCFLAGQWQTGNEAWALSLNGNGTLNFIWYPGGEPGGVSSTMPVPLGRVAVRAYFDPSGTSGATQVIFYTAPTMSGSWTQLGNAVPITASFAATGTIPLTVGYSAQWYQTAYPGPAGLQGAVYELRLYSAATLVADPVFSAQTAGTTSFADAQGNTWSLSGSASISGRTFRAHAECTTLPQRWDNTGTDVWTPVSAAGVLRRIQQGNAPLPSVMKRAMKAVTAGYGTLAYWPCEDYQGSTQIASGLAGGVAMTFNGAPSFQGTAGSQSADSSFACSAQLPQVQSSTWFGSVPVTAASLATGLTNSWFLLSVPSGGLAAQTTFVQLMMSDGNYLNIGYATASSGTLEMSWNGGASTPALTGINGTPLMVQVALEGSGSPSGTAYVLLPGQAASSAVSTTFTVTSSTMAVSRVFVNPLGSALGATEIGQIVVTNGSTAPLLTAAGAPGLPMGLAGVLAAYSGETAGNRFLRLCSENGIAGRVYGYPELTTVMGAQPIDTFANLLQYCEDADRGQLYEPAEALGAGYRTLGSLCAQGAGLTLNYTAGEIGDGSALLEPTDDDQYTINDVTCERNGGSSAQVQVTSGVMSINAPPSGVGDYSTQITLYNAYDADLPRIAGWMSWAGSANVERYPSVPLSLARPQLAALTDAIQALRIGDYFVIENMPAWMPPGNVNQLLWGYTESLGGFHWDFTVNSVPEDPYAVAVAGTAYADTPGCELAAAVSAAATTLTVANAADPWTTTAGFGLQLAGEVVDVTAVGSGGSGSVTSPTGFAQLLTAVPLPPGTWLVGWTVALSGTVSGTDANHFLLCTEPGGATVATSVNAGAAGTYPQNAVPVTISGSLTGITIKSAGTGTTGAVYTGTITSPQQLTVTRSVNGVSKSQAAGAAVNVYPQAIAALAGNH